jgi:hypothetical protein
LPLVEANLDDLPVPAHDAHALLSGRARRG